MTFTSADVYQAIAKVDRPRAEGYNARLGDLWFRTATHPETPIGITLRDSLAPRGDERGSMYENVLDIGYAWARTQLDGGEGLDWDPSQITRLQAEIATDASRFYDSYNIDITNEDSNQGDPYAIRISQQFEALYGSITDADAVDASLDFLYIARGTTVYWYADIDSDTSTDSHVFTSNIKTVAASPDDTVAILLDNGDVWIKPHNATEFAIGYDTSTDGDDIEQIWWAKGRLICWRLDTTTTDSSELGEFGYTTTGPPGNPIITGTLAVFDTFWGNVLDVIDGGPAIIAAISDGTIRSYVAEIVDTSTGNIEIVIKGRFETPKGEYAIALGYNSSVLGFLTATAEVNSKTDIRYYEGMVLDARFDYVVGNVQLRREWIEAFESVSQLHQHLGIIKIRDGLLFSIHESNGETHLWIHDVVTKGLHRHSLIGSYAIESFTIFQKVPVILRTTGALLRETTSYHDLGWMIFPNLTFGLNTPINWIAYVLEASNLLGSGLAVRLYRSSDPSAIGDVDHSTWVLENTLNTQAESGIEQQLVNVTSRTLALKVELVSNTSNDETPALTRTAIRGIPKHRDFILNVPINISDWIEVPKRKAIRITGWGDAVLETVQTLAGAYVEAELLDPPILFRGVVDNFGTQIPYVTTNGSTGRAIVVQLRGQRWSVGQSTIAGEGGRGIGLRGVGLRGVTG